MKALNKFLVVALAATVMASANVVGFSQNPTINGGNGNQTRPRLASKNPEPAQIGAPTAKSAAVVEGDAPGNDQQPAKGSDPKNLETILLADPSEPKDAIVGPATPVGSLPADGSADITNGGQANRHEQASEEAAIVPYYNNFFNTYRLGPEDVVSVNVFGQDRYSRSGIIIPPSDRI